MQVFVTGGSGFVGRHLVAELRARGHSVRALSRSGSASDTVRKSGAEPVSGDLDDLEGMAQGMRGCELVVHAAAHVKDWGARREFFRINVTGTENVLAAAHAAGVRRLVHVGTEAGLVGGGPLHQVDETRAAPARPVGLYPLTKKLAEERVLAERRLETVVVRPRLVWGRGDTSLLPQFATAVRAGRFAWVSGGHYLTSTCHVRNACAGTLLAAERGRPGEIYFLTDGPPVEFRTFLTALLRAQGLDPGNRSVPRPLATATAFAAELLWKMLRLRGSPPITRSALLLIGEEVTVSDAKARRELGYREVVSREAGLAELVAEGVPKAPDRGSQRI